MIFDDAQLYRLPGGLRLVLLHAERARSGVFGIAVAAGSAADPKDKPGVAHFVEHTIFKGTANRSSWDIINCMESVGGELNAFTTKEETTVYTIFPAGNDEMGIELVADLSINASFPHSELCKEREVVVDEINSYRDSPSEAIFDDIEDMVYHNSALGHNILGTVSSVRRLRSEDCRRFIAENYTKGNSVLFYSGPEEADEICRLVSRYFESLPDGSARDIAEATFICDKKRCRQLENLHQAHVAIAIPGVCHGDPLRSAWDLFNNYIGGPGMNSLLNVELRERRGLVYTVEATSARFRSTGATVIYFGCDPEDVKECLEICDNTIASIINMPDAKLEQALTKAKKQYLGQLTIAAENRENRVLAAARATLFLGEPVSSESVVKAINAVTVDNIKHCAAEYQRRSTLILTNEHKH